MRKLISLTLIGAALVGCTSQSLKEGQYRINGTAEGMDGQTVYLYMYDEVETLDSVVVKDGKFQFTGSTEAAVVTAALVLEKYDRKDYRHYPTNICSLLVEPTEMTVSIATPDSLAGAEVIGSKSYDVVKAYRDLTREPSQYLNDLYYFKLRPETDPEKKAELQAEYDSKLAALQATISDFKAKNPGSYQVVQDSALLLRSNGVLDSMKEYYESFSPAMQKTEPLRELKEEIDALTAVMPGSVAPDFSKTDINGNEFSLSSLKGHYVLVDFWASWCVPCRQSNPHILALMKKYQDQGFLVVGVADNDSSPDTWRKAVADDGTESFYHVLRGMNTGNDLLKLYAVHYLPTKYLIDPEGKIVGKMDDKEIEEALQAAYGF